MKILSSFKDLTRFERLLWIGSLLTVSGSFLLTSPPDYLTLIASLIGVTALIFVAKGYVLGQFLTVLFSVFYGIISFYFRYYGEMITYLCMSAPIAVMSLFSWLKHPFKQSGEVEVSRLTRGQCVFMWISTVFVGIVFYFVLRWLENANLLISTFSVITSFLASYLTFCRSPYYALAYAANDLVLIVLWILATLESFSYLPMVFCFVMFLANDMYGFFNWHKMEKKQSIYKNNK